jgi:hypothetical protein
MYVYVYQADLLCAACGEDMIARLQAQGATDTGDSGDYPQGPYAYGGGEADCPHHCGNGEACIDAEELGGRLVGAFLENPLTDDGTDYVREKLAETPESPVVQLWAEFYGIQNDHT